MTHPVASTPARRAIVLGAGMIGTCTALHLQQRGFDVALVDRREPGQETSYGNAGLIQREAVEPYPFPRQWGKVLQAALGRGVDVHYHAAALPALARPLWRYWRDSGPTRYPQRVQAYARLIAHCLDEHRPWIEQANATDLVRPIGYLDVFRTGPAFEAAARDAARLAHAFGLDVEVLDAAALARAEPALRPGLAGAVHWRDPWACADPGALVARYARLFVQRGGRLVRADALALSRHGGGWRLPLPGGDTLDAPVAVVALGPWSDTLLRRLGYRLPLFVKRGYHQHYAHGSVLQRPVLDVERGYVLAPMRRGLRLTTGAEFAHRDAPATPVQVGRAEHCARELIELGHAVEVSPWLGARPCTPDMLPVMGPAPRHPGLWFNFGHSHQGFTLGPVAGRLLAEMIAGEPPFLDPVPYRPGRFAG